MERYILPIYRRLGGIQENPTLRPGGWDMNAGGILVELDEEQHFNRYRAATLESDWAHQLPWAPMYRTWCDTEEDTCLRRAGSLGLWSSPSPERQFGPSASPRMLDSPGGSARWKQRAIYDAIRDAASACGVIRNHQVARVSVHDTVAGTSLNAILAGKALPDIEALIALIHARAYSPD